MVRNVTSLARDPHLLLQIPTQLLSQAYLPGNFILTSFHFYLSVNYPMISKKETRVYYSLFPSRGSLISISSHTLMPWRVMHLPPYFPRSPHLPRISAWPSFISSNAMQSENCRRWLFSIFNCASSIVVVHTHSDLDDDTNSCTQGSDVNFIHIGLGWQLNFPKNGEPMGSTNVTLNSGPKH
jgi:hypothetical protein